MLKIRISYNHKPEAERVLRVLSPLIRGAKIRKSDKGNYKKIYIETCLEYLE